MSLVLMVALQPTIPRRGRHPKAPGPGCFGIETQVTGFEILLVNVSESVSQIFLSPNPK